MGRDLMAGEIATDRPVSIHAPAWGATRTFVAKVCLRVCFNPRARMGRDKRWGVWGEELRGFNPRARMGRDFFFDINDLLLPKLSDFC